MNFLRKLARESSSGVPPVRPEVGRVAPNAPWPVVPLGDIAEVKLGKMLDKAKQSDGTPLKYLRNINVRWGHVDTADLLEMAFRDEELERFGLQDGDVLVCEGGEPGRAAVWTGGVTDLKYQKALHRVRFNQPYEPRLFVYYLELLAKTGGLERRFTGSTIKHFPREVFVQLPIPLPPLPEQRRIVAEIEAQFTKLDAGVAALKRVQANLKRYRAAVLKAACEGKLVPTEAELRRTEGRGPKTASIPREGATNRAAGASGVQGVVGSNLTGPTTFETGEQLLQRILAERRKSWQGRGKYKEPVAPDISGLPSLPRGWAWATLDALTEITGGITKDQKRKHTEPTRSVPYLRVANVQRGYLDLSEVKEIIATEGDIQELALRPGDILLNEGGDRDKLGRGSVWNDELPECIHQNHVFRARVFADGMAPRLVSWYANTFGQKFFSKKGSTPPTSPQSG